MPRADFYLIDKPRFREQPLLLVCELARRGYAANLPILVATPQMDVPSRALLINLRDAAPAGSFQRVLEVVPADPAARGPLRERWKHYQALGFELNKYDM